MKRLWIVSELFYPEETSTAYILTEIANTLAKKYEVNVITGPEVYEKGKVSAIDSTLDSSVKIFRTNPISADKNTVAGKIARFVIVSHSLYKMAKKMIKRDDIVLIVTNPAPLVLLMSKLKRKIGFKYYLLVHDIFPENIASAGLRMPSLMYSILKRKFDRAYSEADTLISLGRDMSDVLAHKIAPFKESKISIVENWADIDNIFPIQRKRDGKIVLEYAGNIGRVQGLSDILEIFSTVSNEILEMSFWGAGAKEASLKQFAEEHNLKNVKFNGPYKRCQQNDVLNDCDIALITLAKGMYGLGVPSKLYNILASGKPILFVGDKRSEVGLLVDEYDIGYSFDVTEKECLKKFLSDLTLADLDDMAVKGANARKLVEKSYSKDAILSKFLHLID